MHFASPAREEGVVRALSDAQLIRQVVELRHALDLVERHAPRMREKHFSHIEQTLNVMEAELQKRGYDPAAHPALTRDERGEPKAAAKEHGRYRSP